jgi:hypothetical protein
MLETDCVRDPDAFKYLKLNLIKIVTSFDPSNRNNPLTYDVDDDDYFSFDYERTLEIVNVL